MFDVNLCHAFIGGVTTRILAVDKSGVSKQIFVCKHKIFSNNWPNNIMLFTMMSAYGVKLLICPLTVLPLQFFPANMPHI